jgi:SAM-dependent methyltransferase
VSDRTMEGFACPACGGSLHRLAESVGCDSCGRPFGIDHGILDLRLGQQGASGYDPRFADQLASSEERHFWFVARRRIVLDALKAVVPDLAQRRLMDVGCGTGGLAAFLTRSGVTIAGGCDSHLEMLLWARRRLGAPLALVDDGRLPPIAAGRQMLSLFDVLEHLDDDRQVLLWSADKLSEGGVLILTVPAHPALFGGIDTLAHHRRRYSLGDLRAKLEAAGFDVLRLTHFMATTLPIFVASRFVLPRRSETRLLEAELRVTFGVNAVLGLLLAIERRLLRHVNLPLGTSILAIARKRASASDQPSAHSLAAADRLD